jgi:hypothetical protein
VPPTPATGIPLNPGYIGLAASTPFYKTTNDNQAQYYWGSHPFTPNMAALENYNNVPQAPATPWGAQTSAVGGTRYLDVNTFLNNMFGTKLTPQPSPTYGPVTKYQYPTAYRPWQGINPMQGALPTISSPVTAPVAPVTPSVPEPTYNDNIQY